jgi:hypothetical protein
MAHTHHFGGTDGKPWIVTYKPILLLFAFLLAITALPEWTAGKWVAMRWMNHFMAGFFLAFSFFKLLDLDGFVENYAAYDLLARGWDGWGYVYPFVELLLGLAFLTGFQPLFTNVVTLVVMSVSLVGVLQTVLNKRKVSCACLGAVFNVPMSTITVMEDVLMILMSVISIATLIK